MEPDFVEVTVAVEDHAVLQVDPADTNDVVSGDVLVLDLEEHAGVVDGISGNHKAEALVPGRQLVLSAFHYLGLGLLGTAASSQLHGHKQFHSADDFGVPRHNCVQD